MATPSAESKYDEALQKLLSADGEWAFAENIFSFFRRKTTLLAPSSWQKVQELAARNVQQYAKEPKEKPKQKEMEKAKDKETPTQSERVGDKPKQSAQDKAEKKTTKTKADKEAQSASAKEPESTKQEPQTSKQEPAVTKASSEAKDNSKKANKKKNKKPEPDIIRREEPLPGEFPARRVDGVEAEADKDDEESGTSSSGEKLVGNGGKTDRYSFTQTLSTVLVEIPIPANTVKKQLKVDYDASALSIKIAGQPEISGRFSREVDVDNSTWTIEDKDRGKERVLVLDLKKSNKMEWWNCVLEGDPKIDTTKIVPENSRLEDLDADTRQTVEKMMFDQRQKQMGKPTTEEMKKQEALKKFMSANPQFDFSQSNIKTDFNFS